MNNEMLDSIQLRLDKIIAQSPFPEDVFHSINTLEWVLKLSPDADTDPALQFAALGHDIERGFEDRCVHASLYNTFDEYKQAHALNCAEILVEILEEYGVEQYIIDDVAHLVANHEVGGDEREELLKNADTLSFFHVSLPLYYDRRGSEITKKRCVWGFKKLPPDLQEIVKKIDYPDEDLKKLILESIGE
ncbi:DUF4202 family protein [Candidatus Latescibacterota bacterium]